MGRGVTLFLAWTVVGFIASFVLLYGFTAVGLGIVLLVWLAYRYLPTVAGCRRPEALGALAGFGVFCVFVATTVDGDPLPFVVAGVPSVAAAILCYIAAGRARCIKHTAVG